MWAYISMSGWLAGWLAEWMEEIEEKTKISTWNHINAHVVKYYHRRVCLRVLKLNTGTHKTRRKTVKMGPTTLYATGRDQIMHHHHHSTLVLLLLLMVQQHCERLGLSPNLYLHLMCSSCLFLCLSVCVCDSMSVCARCMHKCSYPNFGIFFGILGIN